MTLDRDHLTRRDFLGGAAAAVGALALPATAGASEERLRRLLAREARTPGTLLYAARDTPEGFDIDQADTDLTEQIGSACYGGDIVRYKLKYNRKWQCWLADVLAPGNTGIDRGLAERIDVSPDQRVFTFHLRRNARSPYGNPLTADDVLWSFRRSIALKSNGGFFANVMRVTNARIKKLDDHTVRFTLPAPNPLFLRIDAMKYQGGLFDSKEARSHATAADPWAKEWLAANTAGFDGYHVSSVTKGRQLILEANPGWFRGKPDFQRIEWNVVPSAQSRLALLLRGDSDLVLNLTPPQVRAAKNARGINVSSYVGNGLTSLVLNVHWGPLRNKLVRQAIAQALPYRQIVESVYLGGADFLRSPIPASYPGSTDDFWDYREDGNVDRARQLLQQAGQGPFTLPLIYDASDFQGVQIAPIIRAALRNVGITVKLRPATTAVLGDLNFNNKYPARLLEPHPFIADPGYALWVYFHSRSAINYNRFKNATFDRLVDRALTEPNFATRVRLARQAQEIWMDETPWVLLAARHWQVAHSERVGRVAWFSDGWVRFQTLKAL
jgi:peptide/nickel transport system substrate-binding protein